MTNTVHAVFHYNILLTSALAGRQFLSVEVAVESKTQCLFRIL